jgi:sarcosine oxidase subunit beta
MMRFPLMERAGLLREWAGLYEVTPDAHPVIDGLSEPGGFYVVAGFSGHGFMHGPIAGKLIAEMILDGQPSSLDVHPLRLSRFAEDDLVREHNVV